jgi:hypothetical protein
MQTNFIAGRTFQDEKDIKGQLRDWMDNYANKRIHGTTRKIPKEVFLAEEKGKLQPLPKEEFTFFNRGTRIVAKNCHIHLENNYYSVPAHLIEKELTVRWNEHIVRIIYQGEQIALHHKTTGQGNHVTVREHMPDYKVYSQTEYQARYEAKMSDIGDHGHQYFKMLLEKNASYWFRGVRSILGLCNKYEKDAVNQSLKRALYHSVTEITTIRHILEKELYLLPLEPKLLEKHVEKPEGEDSLHRDLSYYS